MKSQSLRRCATLVVPFLLAVGAMLGTGCGPGNVIAKNKTISEVDDQQATCKVAKDPLNPLIVEWPATSKVALDSASKRGIVVVSYAGCTLKVLNECHAKGNYDYTGVTPARDKIDISSQDDLYARLPLGAVNLKGELDSGSSLKLDYIAVGQRVSNEAPTELEGEGCEGATHYIRTITLGAYALDASAKAEAGASVDVGNAGAGGKRKEGDRRLRGSGDVDKCSGESPKSESAAADSGCGAPLQLDLAPLRRQGSSGHVVASSFGEGLHTLNLAPTELSKGETNIAGVASLKDIDPDYLKLFQDALHADRGENVRPQDKANAWAALASYPGQNPKKKLAEQRRDEWQKTSDDLEKLKTQYLSDKSKLDKILALDDEVVPKTDKAAYQQQFAQTYEPHEKLLSVALGTNISSGSSSAGGDKPAGSTTSSSSSDDEKFRIDAEGGYDLQQLSYDFAGSTTLAQGTTGKGDGGGSGGFVGALLSLPSIPVPGVGLSTIVRYNMGSDISRILAGGGIRIGKRTDNSGFGIGLYISYVKLLKTRTADALASAEDKQRYLDYQALIDNSKGGVDFKLNFAYEYYFASVISISAGGGIGYAIIPSAINLKVTDNSTGMPVTKDVLTSGTVKGFGANLNGGLALHF